MPLNVITAKFCSGSTQAWTDEAWQWNYGQVLQFDGLTLPEAYEVHFSNTPMDGDAPTQIGNADGVLIPDHFFTTGKTIYAWVFLHEGQDDGETVYMVTIPIKKKPKATNEQPTPEEQSAITQAIAALNVAVEKADEAITHYPKLENGTWWVWDVASEAWVDTGVVAQGEDGFSPSANVVKVGHTATITITDKSGTTTASISDGSGGGGGGGAVDSVNGKTGAVVLDAEDVGALPDNTSIPSKISELQNDMNGTLTPYGVCTTAAGTGLKTVTIPGITELVEGMTIWVRFNSSNTASGPRLQVNSLAEKPIYRYGTMVPGAAAISSWNTGALLGFTYDGTGWVMHDWLNTTYSNMSLTEATEGTVTGSRVIAPNVFKAAVLALAPYQSETWTFTLDDDTTVTKKVVIEP